MTRSTLRSRTLLLFACTFVFTAGLSTAVFAAACTPQAIVNCERLQRNCLNNGIPADACERGYLGCMGRAGCEVP
ncbi:MAG: hypothetical protein JF591_05750 [Lysobacter sp.]|nr:hypothetical protein [Lysobacter sp.]